MFQLECARTKARYKGEYTKRGPLASSDCESLAPGASLEAEVVLDDWYELPSGPFLVWYEAFHNPPGGEGTLWLVCSNKVELGG